MKIIKNPPERLIRWGLYLIAFCALVFLTLYVNSYFWLEGLKLDVDDVMSLDRFENIPQK